MKALNVFLYCALGFNIITGMFTKNIPQVCMAAVALMYAYLYLEKIGQ